MADEEKLQEQYMQYQVLQQHIEQLQRHLEQISEQEGQLLATKNAIQELDHVKKGSKLLVPVANGIFLQASLISADELRVNVGANVSVSKSRAETIVLLEKQHTSIREVSEHLSGQMAEMSSKLQILEQELTKAVENV